MSHQAHNKRIKFVRKLTGSQQSCSRLSVRYAYKRIMRFLALPLFLSSATYAEYDFEISKFSAGNTCEGMVGTWYTDVTLNSDQDGTVRHITKVERNVDGSAQLKGLSIYVDHKEANPWSFPSEWSCDGSWYTEKNEWGYTSFEIISLGAENVLKDTLANLGAGKLEVVERPSITFSNMAIENYFRDD